MHALFGKVEGREGEKIWNSKACVTACCKLKINKLIKKLQKDRWRFDVKKYFLTIRAAQIEWAALGTLKG